MTKRRKETNIVPVLQPLYGIRTRLSPGTADGAGNMWPEEKARTPLFINTGNFTSIRMRGGS